MRSKRRPEWTSWDGKFDARSRPSEERTRMRCEGEAAADTTTAEAAIAEAGTTDGMIARTLAKTARAACATLGEKTDAIEATRAASRTLKTAAAAAAGTAAAAIAATVATRGGDRWGGDRDRGHGGDRGYGGDRPRGVCFDWQKGRCDRGESCRFAHEGEQRA